jgi:NTP pyrophosphatase (non-canonical NTP hydrolase)
MTPKEKILSTTYSQGIIHQIDCLVDACHDLATEAGWWKYTDGKIQDFNVPEKLMLVVSEVAEAMEGFRKDLMDDKLSHRKMIEVELADAAIRIFDLAGAMQLDLGGAVAEKLLYNASRDDHKPENRAKEGGKKF